MFFLPAAALAASNIRISFLPRGVTPTPRITPFTVSKYTWLLIILAVAAWTTSCNKVLTVPLW